MSQLEDYREVVPKGTVDFLKRLAEQVKGKKDPAHQFYQAGGRSG
jgi:hypothetical protein